MRTEILRAERVQQILLFCCAYERGERITRERRAERADRGVNNQVKEYYYFFCDLFLTCFVNIKITATYQGHQSYISQVYNHDLIVTFATLTHRRRPLKENLTLKRTKNKEIKKKCKTCCNFNFYFHMCSQKIIASSRLKTNTANTTNNNR